MHCPACQSEDTQVKDSRTAEDGAAIRRRRQCQACGERFTTFERIQLKQVTVVKRSGRRALFERDKLAHSIQLALNKRPVPQVQIDRAVNRIVREVEGRPEPEIASSVIGDLVMRELAELDPVAFVRYASVYMDFDNVEDFGRFIIERGLAAHTSGGEPGPGGGKGKGQA